jgi:hypothetical protein
MATQTVSEYGTCQFVVVPKDLCVPIAGLDYGFKKAVITSDVSNPFTVKVLTDPLEADALAGTNGAVYEIVLRRV